MKPATTRTQIGCAEIRIALGRVLDSPSFRSAPRLATLLRFVVERTLAGEGPRLKGYTIAVEAFGRGPDFDPQLDPIVRVEAGRLRRRLERFYAGEGASEPVAIELPRVGYVPVFHRRATAAPLPHPDRDGEAIDASLRDLIGLCRSRLQALAAEVALVESMIAQARAEPRPARSGGGPAV